MLRIEHAVPKDAAGIYEVMRATWIATYPVPPLGISEDDIRAIVERDPVARIERWKTALSEEGHACFVARDRASILGYVAPFVDPETERQRLGALYVLPEYQWRGLGGALLSAALEAIGPERDVYLHVASFNIRAIDFYRGRGFVQTGVDTTGSSVTAAGVAIPEFEMVRRAGVDSPPSVEG
jgi:GNAT superfamily N-acetyltransferase